VVALVASGSVLVVELWAAWVTGSLALLSDAGHLLVDLSGLAVAYVALRIASRPATAQATYGFTRAEVLAAAFNGFLLIGIGTFIVIRGIERLRHPLNDLDYRTVLWVAILGLVANLVAAQVLRADARTNINTRGALINVLGDALASIGVIVSAILVGWTGDPVWDTIVSFFVAAIIGVSAIALLRTSAAILLEVAPPHIDLAEVKRRVEEIPDIVNVHDLHVWTHTPGRHSVTLHATIRPSAVPHFHHVIGRVEELLAGAFDLHHCTIQLEPTGHDEVSDRFDPVRGVMSDEGPAGTHPAHEPSDVRKSSTLRDDFD
jgi:cobalt-zinc-cadmium efflux system protein